MASKQSKYQTFTMETVNRKDIKGAPYNPRIIDADAKKRLKEGLKKHGLVQPIVMNKRTGNLVGGHQRLSQLDSLEKSKDYTLQVAVIDVDEREEAEINIQLNNPSMGGEWDFDKLADIAQEWELTFDDMGFSEFDIDVMFDGDDRFSNLMEPEPVHETKEKLEKMHEARKKMKEGFAEKDNIDFYTVIVFADDKERRAFHQRIGVSEYEQYVSPEHLERLAK